MTGRKKFKRLSSKLLLTVGADTVVGEVVLSKPLVFDHAELHRLDDFFVIVELVISQEYLLEGLRDGDAGKDFLNTLVSKHVALKMELFKRGPCIDEDLKERLGCVRINTAVS